MSEERVKQELDRKHDQLRQQYAGEMKNFWKKKRYEFAEFLKVQRIEYAQFFKNCPQTGKYALFFIAGFAACLIFA